MDMTGDCYYLDHESVVKSTPDVDVDLLRQTMPTIIPQTGKGHNIAVFDNPTIYKLLKRLNIPPTSSYPAANPPPSTYPSSLVFPPRRFPVILPY